MRRTPLSRSIAALLAPLFALGMAESSALHRCPMHDGGVARPAASHADAHPVAHIAGHGETSAPAVPAAPEHDGAHGCSCLGECGVTAAVSAPAVRTTVVPTVVADARPPVFVSRIGAHSAPRHVRPPSTAPPARAA